MLGSIGAGHAAEIPVDGLRNLPSAYVYILGEIHDNPEHHRNQAIGIKALRPKAVVFEMLTTGRYPAITPELWAETGFPSYDIYKPVFDALDGAVIYGAALPREIVRASVTTGAAAQLSDDAARFELDEPLPQAQQDLRNAGQMAAHCDALPENMLPGMVEAQRLRDAAFARDVIQAVQTHGGPVVLITGNGHARTDWGVASFIKRVSDFQVYSVGQLETGTESAPYDAWIVTEPIARADPCLAFR